MVIVRRLAIGLLLTLSAAGSAQNAAEPPLVPLPARMELQAGAPFEIGAATAISVSSADPAAVRVSRELTELIRRSTGRTLSTPSPATTNRIDIALDAARQALGTEGYELTIDAQRVALTAASPAGLFYGLQTIRQLLPAISEYEAVLFLEPRGAQLPALRIVDTPRFAWRAAMLDVARHFFAPDDVKRYIDLIALHKMNRLHLQITYSRALRGSLGHSAPATVAAWTRARQLAADINMRECTPHSPSKTAL